MTKRDIMLRISNYFSFAIFTFSLQLLNRKKKDNKTNLMIKAVKPPPLKTRTVLVYFAHIAWRYASWDTVSGSLTLLIVAFALMVVRPGARRPGISE